MASANYSVWVGGVEVNDYALDLDNALEWAEGYRQEGYDDVGLEKIEGDWADYKFKSWESA